MRHSNYLEVQELMHRRSELVDFNTKIEALKIDIDTTYLDPPLIKICSRSSTLEVERTDLNKPFIIDTIQKYEDIIEAEIKEIDEKLKEL